MTGTNRNEHFPHLFCIQESISDFYWYYSGKDIIDEPGKRNFSKAMNVAKQVFNSLTEYIQVRQLYDIETQLSAKTFSVSVRVHVLVTSSLWLTAGCGMPLLAFCTSLRI